MNKVFYTGNMLKLEKLGNQEKQEGLTSSTQIICLLTSVYFLSNNHVEIKSFLTKTMPLKDNLFLQK